MRISVEEELGPNLGITNYNIRQIVNMESLSYSSDNKEVMAEEIIGKTYNNSFIKTFKRVKEADYIKKSRLLWSTTDFLENIQTYLGAYKPKKATEFKYREGTESWEFVIALTDLHLWKEWTDVVVDRLTTIADSIISKNLERVHIFCLGDLVETLVQWGMHDWQIETMGSTYWFELLMNVVEIFEDFLLHIVTHGVQVEFYWLSWNHDRMTKDREWDKSRLWGLIIYELIKRWLMNIEWVEINIVQDYIKTVDIGDIRYIVAHGDMSRIPKRKWSDIAWIHWDNTKTHNVIMYGHLHNVSITEEKSITKIGLPWLAGTDQYATKELDLHSAPWYVEITHNSYWSVDILIKRLAYDDNTKV